MSEAPKLSQVATLDFRSESTIKELEELLEKAKRGEVRAVAAAYEYTDGTGGWSACFGSWTHRVAMIGRLTVLAMHITKHEIDD